MRKILLQLGEFCYNWDELCGMPPNWTIQSRGCEPTPGTSMLCGGCAESVQCLKSNETPRLQRLSFLYRRRWGDCDGHWSGSSLCLSIVSSRVTVFSSRVKSMLSGVSSRVTTVVTVFSSRVTVDQRVRRFPPLSRLSMKIALNGRSDYTEPWRSLQQALNGSFGAKLHKWGPTTVPWPWQVIDWHTQCWIPCQCIQMYRCIQN